MSGLKPFFCYFGGKWRAAPHYPPPEHRTIVEPFAGAAGYALRYADRDVHLYDLDPKVAGLWSYLIRVSAKEILSLPLKIEEGKTVRDLPVCEEAQWLIGFWLNKGSAAPCNVPSAWMRGGLRPKSYWGVEIRARVAAQVDKIRHWKIFNASYTAAPDDLTATWYIDPPYQRAGLRYTFNAAQVDFAALAAWARARRGLVIVCENEGATWLPFQPFMSIKSTESHRKVKQTRSAEVIYVQRSGEGDSMTRVAYYVNTPKACLSVEVLNGVVVHTPPMGRAWQGRPWTDIAEMIRRGGGTYEEMPVDGTPETDGKVVVAVNSQEGNEMSTSTTKRASARKNGKAHAESKPHAQEVPLPFKNTIEAPAPMAGAYVRRVASNVKGGVDCTISPKTLIVGRNGSAKSAVVQTIELALTASASDIAGRALVAKDTDLLALATGRSDELMAGVELSDGRIAKYTKKEGKRAEHVLPPGIDADRVFPLRAIREAIMGSAETARRFFLQHAVGKIEPAEVRKRVAPLHHVKFDKMWKHVTEDLAILDTVTAILRVVSEAKAKGLKAAADAKAQGEASAVTSAALAPEPTQSDLRLLAEKLEAAKQAYSAAVVNETLGDARQQVASLSAEREQLVAQILQCQGWLDQNPEPPMSAVLATVVSALRVGQQAAGQGVSTCFACGVQHSDASQLGIAYGARIAEAEAVITQTQALATQRAQVIDWLAKARAHVQVLDTRVADFNDKISKAQGARLSMVDAKATLDLVEQEVGAAQSLIGQWAIVRKSHNIAEAGENEADAWKKFAKEMMRVVAELLDGAADAFAARVQKYLPKRMRFGLELVDGEREVLRFGFWRAPGESPEAQEAPEVLHIATSVSEWALLTVALAATVAEGSPFSILVPEDRPFDPVTLGEVLAALAAFPGQVLVMSPILPFAVPHGWQVVDVDAGGHKKT